MAYFEKKKTINKNVDFKALMIQKQIFMKEPGYCFGQQFKYNPVKVNNRIKIKILAFIV